MGLNITELPVIPINGDGTFTNCGFDIIHHQCFDFSNTNAHLRRKNADATNEKWMWVSQENMAAHAVS